MYTDPVKHCSGRNGFTMLELLIAMAIAALVLAVSVPSTARFYQSMQYREAVRDVISLLSSARYKAIQSGRTQDVRVNPETNEIQLGDERKQLPEAMNIAVHSASELNQPEIGVLRFYPEGGSSGGGVDIESPTGRGVKITVDWLAGRVSQEPYEIE
ncbi:MAG: prepilin-type N-terminal cleavage/methylation domain-containing protein [Halioglobus sp.]